MTYEILTAEQMSEADRLTIAGGVTGYVLMSEAGRGVATAVREIFPNRKILVLCGPGNNGGDGFVAASVLKKNRMIVRVACVVPVSALKDDAARAAAEWRGDVLAFEALKVSPDEVVVDAVFGTGFKGALKDPVAGVFRQITEQGNDVLAVDSPSGVDGSTGAVAEGTLDARATVTFFRKKLGHVLLPGKAYCGAVRVIDIGIPDSVLDRTGYIGRENAPPQWQRFIKPKKHGNNKYDYGHVIVYGGPRLTGAAQMAAHAVLRAGAGLCTIAAHPDATSVYRNYMPNIMVEEAPKLAAFAKHLEDERRNVALIGPGAGLDDDKALRTAVLELCATGKAAVIDADALSAFREHRAEFHDALHENCVLTPHEGEFKRIFPDLQGLKTERAVKAARICGAIVLLKGADTVIAAPDGRFTINTNAPSTLATGGSGDVLAGMIAGLLARNVPAFEAACAAAWMHGEAAQQFGAGLIATDIIDTIPAVLGELT